MNAHPHFDAKNRVALVHNGIISNYFDLRKQLKEKYGIEQKSQTDTEIVSIWIGVFLDEGLSLFDSIKKVVTILEGAYSFLLISTLDPEAMYVVKNTGTMVIGFPESLKKKGMTDKESLDNLSEKGSNDGDDDPKNHKF